MRHPGEEAVQRLAGVSREDWGSAGVGPFIPPVGADFLAGQHLVVIAAADDNGAVWAGALTGPPGFTVAQDNRTIVIDRLPADGDPLAGSFEETRDIGMIAIEPASRRRMRLNGQARRDRQRLVVRTEQVYANCPKYIQTRTPAGAPPLPPDGAEVTSELTAGQQQWIQAADTFFVGTRAPGLGADASHRGGGPGFVTIRDDRHLSWPDYAGNGMYMTLGNLEVDPRCGLLFLDWENGRTLQLTGRARIDWDPGRAAAIPGAKRLIDFEVEKAVQISGGMAVRWSFGQFFRHNPPVYA